MSKEQIVLSIGNQIFLLDSTAKWDELNFIDCYERMANQLGEGNSNLGLEFSKMKMVIEWENKGLFIFESF